MMFLDPNSPPPLPKNISIEEANEKKNGPNGSTFPKVYCNNCFHCGSNRLKVTSIEHKEDSLVRLVYARCLRCHGISGTPNYAIMPSMRTWDYNE